jgi:hypothetical protein
LSDSEAVDQLRRTQQVFDLTEQDEQYLRARGIGEEVIVRLRTLNGAPHASPDVAVAAPPRGAPTAYDQTATPAEPEPQRLDDDRRAAATDSR